MNHRRLSIFAAPMIGLLLTSNVAVAAPRNPSRSELEAAGTLDGERKAAKETSVASTKGRPHLGAVDLLLIPDSTADRIMAFDPTTGDLVNADFIPADNPNLQTPKNALMHTDAATVLVVDQISDLVQRYTAAGTFQSSFAPAGGVNTAILDNATGASYRPNGGLVVCVQSGTNANTVAEFDATGAPIGNFIAAGAGGLAGPFDVYFRAGDALVSSINTDQILRYDLAGAFLGVFASINGFPQQIAEASNGNVLVANFSGTQVGVVELTSAGALVGVYNPAGIGSPRGVYELPNGNILVSSSTGVFEISRANTLVSTKQSGASAQYIERAQGLAPVELTKFTAE